MPWLRSFLGSLTSRKRRRRTQLEDPPVERDPRYEPCDILNRANITCRIWCEDVLSCYEVPTVVSDLFLLVSNPQQASNELIKGGYIQTQANQRYSGIPQLSHGVPRLIRQEDLDSSGWDGTELPEADDTFAAGVVLLPAKEWDYKLPESVDQLKQLIPDVSDYFDHIVSKWMDLEENDDGLRDYLGIHIGYHISYIDEVWTPTFAGQIRKEHRQLLFDMLATSVGEKANRVDLLVKECWALHRGIRDQILQGTFEPAAIECFKWKRPPRESIGTRTTITVTPAHMKLIDDID